MQPDTNRASEDSTRSHRRRTILKSIGASSVVALSGCLGDGNGTGSESGQGGTSSSTPTTNDTQNSKGELTYAIIDTAYNRSEETFDEYFSNFEEETGYSVTVNVIPFKGYSSKIQTQLRSGSGPDVFHLDVVAQPKYASQGYLSNRSIMQIWLC